ncbi:MAG: hypothetical protein ACYCTB_08215 [bacterium]
MKLSKISREKLIDLKVDIAEKILILNKYILLVIIEERENIKNLSDILDKKQLFINIMSKIKIDYNNISKFNENGINRIIILKKIISDNINIEKSITDKFSAKQENLGEKIKFLKKISYAMKAYESNIA